MFAPGGPSLRELLQQALSSTDRGYDLLAPKFDLTPFRTPTVALAALAPLLGDAGTIDRGLDLCCGTGAGLELLRPLCRTSVTGLDRSAGMLGEAGRRLGASPGTPVHLVRGDALRCPLRGPFDLITCFGAFGHIRPTEEPLLVDEVYRMLRPGGRFAFFTADTPPWWHAGVWVARAFNAAMHVRNALIQPPFVMYYLTFLLPGAAHQLEARGFEVAAFRGLVPAPYQRLVMVLATRC